MSEMLERVKSAIAKAIAPAVDVRAPYARVMVEVAAIAAVQAMREPTNAMHKAMCDCYNSPACIWMTGIDAVLEEKQ